MNACIYYLFTCVDLLLQIEFDEISLRNVTSPIPTADEISVAKGQKASILAITPHRTDIGRSNCCHFIVDSASCMSLTLGLLRPKVKVTKKSQLSKKYSCFYFFKINCVIFAWTEKTCLFFLSSGIRHCSNITPRLRGGVVFKANVPFVLCILLSNLRAVTPERRSLSSVSAMPLHKLTRAASPVRKPHMCSFGCLAATNVVMWRRGLCRDDAGRPATGLPTA